MCKQNRLTRRQFVGRSALAAAAPYVITSTALGADGRPPASERITMGSIGVGGRGSGNMRGFMNRAEVQLVAVCDVSDKRRQNAKDAVDKHYDNADCAAYNDFREVCSRTDIDAVSVATPDHWHGLTAIEACRNGKDVFCEKPLSITIEEGRAMVAAARRYGRVFSSGSQRVLGNYGGLAQAVRSGAAGEIKEAFVDCGGPSLPCYLPEEPIPDGFDWDMWLGPAPYAPYNPNRCSGAFGLGGKGWRTWQDYSGGMMTDWGGHKFGGSLFALDLHKTGPAEIIPPDGKDIKYLTYIFEGGLRMYHAEGQGMRFIGTEGEIPGVKPARKVAMPGYKGTGGIQGDFIHCVKTRQKPFRDVEIAHRTATVCHLGNIAYWLGRPLRWDPVNEEFIGDDEANRMRSRPMRAPWTL